MGPVIGLKFAHYVPDVEIHGCFGDREHVGYLLIAVAISNQFQDIEFSRR
ncbi:MAG: hypothetical protein WA744_20865 [Candidatus Acidiferrales bacterium]